MQINMHMQMRSARCPASQCRRVPLIRALYSGSRGGGSQSSSGADRRLILPGNANSSAAQQAAERQAKLIIPGQNAQPASGQTPSRPTGDSAATIANDTFGNFRPPAGFMDNMRSPKDTGDEEHSVDAMLQRLSAGAGAWHELAKFLPILARKGLDGTAVQVATGLERPVQNIWSVAAQVYESLKASGEVPEETLAHFDSEGAENQLYEMRFLAATRRVEPAKYIVANNLDARAVTQLSRAVKEHERREGEKIGFSDSPADCLAYQYFRDALECRNPEEKQQYVKKGLKVAETDSARVKLEEVLKEEEQEEAASQRAVLTVFRLTKDEFGVRPIALAGPLGAATQAEVEAAPVTRTAGAFNAFSADCTRETRWVALPAWNVLLLAREPVALSIADCSKNEIVMAASGAKAEKERIKLRGPGLIVFDRQAKTIDEKEHYVVSDGSGKCSLVDGAGITDPGLVIGQVLFCCRPPSILLGPSAETSELIQL